MKKLKFHLLTSALTLAFCGSQPAFGTTNVFITNTAIASGNTNFDGTDIVVTNCTLTVDGAHSFSSLHVATNGVLTHSPSPGGTVSNYLYVTGEEQVLVGANAATLVNDNVVANTVSVTDSTGTILYSNGQDYLLISVPPETELQRAENSSIPNGAIVLVNYQALLGTVPSGLNLSIAGNVQVDIGGAINVNGAGYDGSGPGAGLSSFASGGGGGYGGNGGSSISNIVGGAPYGSYLQATNPGSGGGSVDVAAGGTGGGLVQIAAGGSVTINGLISANGANGTNFSSGGGSGGGISIAAQSLAGSGAIMANGGAGQSTNGGGGGGGRISISYSSTSFTGPMTAYGAAGAMYGTAGTIYTQSGGQDGLLVFDNGGQLSGTNTTLIIQNTALNVLVRSNASIQTPYLNTTPWSVGSLTIASNGFLVIPPTTAFTLDVISAVTVEPGGAITANGKGYGPNTGGSGGIYFNDGLYYPGGGGGYGGNGGAGYIAGAAGGLAYGSEFAPGGFGGSGGGQVASAGGYGGGSIAIVSGGIVQVDGVISANGQNGSGSGGGGGAGGTITLSGGTLLGSGVISANGGAGVDSIGGGGGGGRIWINPLASVFAGTVSAFGGNGANRGGAGTIYTQVLGQDTQLVLDNGGVSGGNTPIQSASGADLIVRGGATSISTGSVSFANLYVYSNSWLSVVAASPNQEFGSISYSVSGNATIEAGGGIMADFGGYSSGQGPGEGHTYESSGDIIFGSGAGHGGDGGSVGSAAGGTTYDSATQPSEPGSGGGGGAPISPGGSGGGVVKLTVIGTLELDGVISANGGNGGGYSGGGGSGGSIWLLPGTFSGAGSVTANGGGGANGLGGGGGGGMIYVSCQNNLFTGVMTAYGGSGTNYGGAGTIITGTASTGYQLILDGGGNTEALTPLPNDSPINVTLRNGAMGYISGQLSLGNLVINTNATLLISNINTLSCSSLDVQAGGSIIADGTGYAGGQGPGEGHFSEGDVYACSGGGSSGEGGNSISNLAVGGVMSSGYNEPQPGSGGGTFQGNISIGGAGGGEISITTTGLMQIDGLISANGLNGSGIGGGGGAGGAITLTCGSLGGGGVIRANGGSGAEMIGGGGGGGWISVTANTTNQFNGTMTAYGGGGANFGGAGFISTKTGVQGQQGAQYVLDNNGNSGPATPIPTSISSSTTGLTVRNGGAAYLSTTLFTCQNLLIGTNGSLVISNLSEGINCTALNIESGGSIIADSNGYAAGLGNEPGHTYGESPDFPCGGGGNVGYGGNSISNLATGGGQFTSYAEQAGSGGGTESPYSVGGNGGGVVYIIASGLIQVDGLISANGANGGGIGGGGGAGGSIVLNCASLAGVGTMRVNGGSGANLIGGGGGGGGVYITVSSTNQFNGTTTAYGGGGANWGGAGLISTETGTQGIQLVLDNGGNPGVPTVISGTSSSTSLTVRDAAAGMITLSSSLSLNNLLITSNSSLFVSNAQSLVTFNLSSADIQPGGRIVADADGYPAGQGTGAGKFEGISPDFPCSGAGHGGTGGNSISNLVTGGAPYDSQATPNTPGSGGGQYLPYSIGGAGGGALLINASGLLQVDGTISVNGGNGTGIGGGGGAGGTFRMTGGTLAGSGTIRANGGNGADSIGGGGGGGCIALNPTANSFVGTLSVAGGTGANTGGAGSIYTQTNNGQSALILDNGGLPGAPTLIDVPPGSSTSLIIRNGAVGYNNGAAMTFGSLLITSNSFLTVNSNITGPLTLTITGNATIEAGGGIVTDGLGAAANSGNGAGHSSSLSPFYPCSGGGYGGSGGYGSNGIAGGSVYSSITSPGLLGSGGGSYVTSVGGSGGGVIRLTVNGTLDDSGRISANGANNGPGIGGGGGSGGSIWLTLGTLEGTGSITANGGNSVENIGGGGGGGRIAITYNTDNFAGAITAHGGSGFAYGGAGTIYTKANSQAVGQVLVENGGNAGTNTPLSAALGAPSTPFNLTVESNAVVSPQTGNIFPVLNSLNISSGASLSGLTTSLSTLDLVILGEANIANGGSISVNGGGDVEGSGPGAGQTAAYTGSGAGYGGVGGNSEYSAGGHAYGSEYQPVDFGSGGGFGQGGLAAGSTGGGALRLNVGGVLTVAGEISAEGTSGITLGSGGGSGGSIWIDTGSLAGGGLIASDGGAGQAGEGGNAGQPGEGGGGAGGRIALYVRTNAYFGSTSVNGGAGYASGGSGTVFISNNVPTLQVLSDSVTGTVTNAVSSFELVFNGAPNPASVSTLLLTGPNGFAISVTVTMLNSSTYLVTFPEQTAIGTYTLNASGVTDLNGRPISPVYTAAFTISLPYIQGFVTDGNGNPLGGVLMTPSAGSSATTDPTGNYSIGFVPGSTLTVTPSSGQLTFLPPSMSYTNISNSITGQNYVGVTSIAPTLSASVDPANFVLGWQGLPTVNYQVYCSTDMVNWVLWTTTTGNNAPIQMTMPVTNGPMMFFSIQASAP